MPEIPDLEGYRAYFNRRLPGLSVESAEAPIPWMARMGRDEFEQRMKGQVWLPAFRRAKYLLFPFESGDYLVVHAMLTGRFEYVRPKQKRRAKTAFIFHLSNGMDFRYFDDRSMGRAYLVGEEEFAERVPRWTEMGPDVLDPELTEVSDEQLAEIYRSVHAVMDWATPIVAGLMEDKGLPANHYRDHLRVHRKGGEDCPRCGHRISEITSGQRVTNFCRGCQE